MFYYSVSFDTSTPASPNAMTATVKTVIGTVLAFFVIFSLAYIPSIHAQSAAEVDWVPAGELDEQQRQTLPWYCDGLYIQPEEFREQTQADELLPIHISAQDVLHVARHSTTFTGDVEIQRGARRINAAFVSVDTATDIATMHGPVTIREPGLLLQGEDATGNFVTGTAAINGATFLLHQSQLRGSAAEIYKDENNQLLIRDGVFTRCDPQQNTWSMHGQSILLRTREGYGVARNVVLKIKQFPVAYFPYFRFPLSDRRQSGFLMPGIGQRSDSGVELLVPYYFNLAPQYDMTYRLRSLWKRGLVHDWEFRYLTKSTNNFIDGAFIREDNIYDDTTDFDLSSGANTPKFKKQDRWLIHVTHESGWNSRWKSSVRYSGVSDNDYLSDIGGSVGSASPGSTASSNERNLANRISPALKRTGSIGYYGDKWTSTLQLQGFQNLDDFSREQYEKLPELSLTYRDSFKLLNLNTKFRYTYFDRDTDGLTGVSAITGQRAVFDVTLEMPLRNRWGFIIPSLNLIHRKYDLDAAPGSARDSPELTTPSLSLDTGLIFDRFFNWRGRQFQQTLEPRLFYLYTQFDRQNDLPQFDTSATTPSYAQIFRRNRFSGYDRIADAQQLSAGVSTSLLSAHTGAELVKASIGQIYYFKDRKVIFRPKPGDDPSANSSALFTQFRLALGSSLTVNSSFEWQPHKRRSNRGNFSFKYHPDDHRIINLTYSYTSPEVQSVNSFQNQEESDVSFIWPIAGKWSLIGRWNFGWDDDQTIESLFGVEYNDCCWKLRIVSRRFLEDPRLLVIVIDDPSSPGGRTEITTLDNRANAGIFLEFQLKGLADLGGRLDRFLEDSIPGYRARENRIGM